METINKALGIAENSTENETITAIQNVIAENNSLKQAIDQTTSDFVTALCKNKGLDIESEQGKQRVTNLSALGSKAIALIEEIAPTEKVDIVNKTTTASPKMSIENVEKLREAYFNNKTGENYNAYIEALKKLEV